MLNERKRSKFPLRVYVFCAISAWLVNSSNAADKDTESNENSTSVAAESESMRVPDPLIATINGFDVRESHIYQQIESVPLGEQIQLRQAIEHFTESVIREEVLFHSLLATNFEDEPELRNEVKTLVVNYLIEKRVTANISITEEAIENFYYENQSSIRGENLRASQIVLDGRAQCDAAKANVNSLDDFKLLAQDVSLDEESRGRDGDIGYMMPHSGPYGFEEKLFELEPNDMAIFEIEDKCHLVRVTEKETPPLPSLDSVRDQIKDLLSRQQQSSLLNDLLEESEKTVEVLRVPAKSQ